MARRATPPRNEEGFDRRDGAAVSFLACPRCGAAATVLHSEPHSGGGICRHEHRCTRCRHEWEAEPASWRLCSLPHCDAHRMDATGLGAHLDLVELALDIRTPVSADICARVLADLGLEQSAGSDPQASIAVIRAARSAVGGDTRLAVAWFHNLNTALGDTPAAIMKKPDGTDRLRDYLEARHVPVAG